MRFKDKLVSIVGCADSCELLSRVFAFPDEDIAKGFSSGAIQSDFIACFSDAGMSVGSVSASCCFQRLRSLEGEEVGSLFEQLRISYSLTYLQPGKPPIFPFEAAFRHVEDGLDGAPALFRSPVTLEVEQCMRAAGVIPRDSRKIPCDSVDNELAFLSYAFGRLAESIHGEDYQGMESWKCHITEFVDEHVARWMPLFFCRTELLEGAGQYRDVAHISNEFTNHLINSRPWVF